MLHVFILSALWTKCVHHNSPESPQQSGQMAFWISQSGCFFPAKNRPLLFLIQLFAKLYNLTASLQLNLFPERCVSSSCVIQWGSLSTITSLLGYCSPSTLTAHKSTTSHWLYSTGRSLNERACYLYQILMLLSLFSIITSKMLIEPKPLLR